MKKLIVALVSSLLTASVCFAATAAESRTVTYTNALGEVYPVVVGYYGTGDVTSIASSGEILVGTSAPTATPARTGQFAIDLGDALYIALDEDSFTAIAPFTVLSSVTLGANYVLTNRTPVAVGEVVYAVSNVVSAATGVGTTGTFARAVGATVNDWVITK